MPTAASTARANDSTDQPFLTRRNAEILLIASAHKPFISHVTEFCLPTGIQNAENVVLAHDDVLCANQLCLGTGVFPKKDAIADFDIKGRQAAIRKPLAMTYGQDFTFLRLLLSRIGNDDAVARGLLFLNPLSPRCGRITVGCSWCPLRL
jgi:hypothetical protein